jgi:hypothetical protein
MLQLDVGTRAGLWPGAYFNELLWAKSCPGKLIWLDSQIAEQPNVAHPELERWSTPVRAMEGCVWSLQWGRIELFERAGRDAELCTGFFGKWFLCDVWMMLHE